MEMEVAKFWSKEQDGMVLCELCPRNCRIAPGCRGYCRVRGNHDGVLIAESFGRPVAIHVDPIEKKPLGYYRPGSKTFSLGTFGCNLGCGFCQNDQLSRHAYESEVPYIAPRRIVELAREHGCESVAFTYNEPTIFIEYMLAIARQARFAGLGTVLVSNGWINDAPRRELYPLIEAANIDLKGFSNDFYASYCEATLEPVLESCRYLKNELGKHLELTNLIIPDCNDSDEMIASLLNWVSSNLGADTPIHFSAYFPAGGFNRPPTPREKLFRAKEIAEKIGFTRINLGNLH